MSRVGNEGLDPEGRQRHPRVVLPLAFVDQDVAALLEEPGVRNASTHTSFVGIRRLVEVIFWLPP